MEQKEAKNDVLDLEGIIQIGNALEVVVDNSEINSDVNYRVGKLKGRTDRVAKVFNKFRKNCLKEAQEITNKKLKENQIDKSDLVSVQEFSIDKETWRDVQSKIEDYLAVKDAEFTVPVFKLSDFNYISVQEEDGKKVKTSKNAATARFIAMMGEYIVKD